MQPPQAAHFQTTNPKRVLILLQLNIMYNFKVIYFTEMALDLIINIYKSIHFVYSMRKYLFFIGDGGVRRLRRFALLMLRGTTKVV